MMTNEEIRGACERALALANSFESDSIQGIAFGTILSSFLAEGSVRNLGIGSQKTERSRDIPRRKLSGLKARLIDLRDGGFFADAKDTGSVVHELKARGYNHATKEISARLKELTRERVFRRVANPNGRKGSYVYSNW